MRREVVKCGELPLPEILPHNTATFEPDLPVENAVSGAKYYLNALYFKDGVEVHKKQLALAR